MIITHVVCVGDCIGYPGCQPHHRVYDSRSHRISPDLHPALIPEHALIEFSATMHWTAPSPIVYPVEPVCGQRHCNEGDEPQRSVSKLTSRKDSKHDTAHDGMKAVMSDPRLNPVVEDAAAVSVALTAMRGIVVAHSSSLARPAAILGNNIYLLVDNGVRMLVENARKSKHGTAERQFPFTSTSPPGDQGMGQAGN